MTPVLSLLGRSGTPKSILLPIKDYFSFAFGGSFYLGFHFQFEIMGPDSALLTKGAIRTKKVRHPSHVEAANKKFIARGIKCGLRLRLLLVGSPSIAPAGHHSCVFVQGLSDFQLVWPLKHELDANTPYAPRAPMTTLYLRPIHARVATQDEI